MECAQKNSSAYALKLARSSPLLLRSLAACSSQQKQPASLLVSSVDPATAGAGQLVEWQRLCSSE